MAVLKSRLRPQQHRRSYLVLKEECTPGHTAARDGCTPKTGQGGGKKPQRPAAASAALRGKQEKRESVIDRLTGTARGVAGRAEKLAEACQAKVGKLFHAMEAPKRAALKAAEQASRDAGLSKQQTELILRSLATAETISTWALWLPAGAVAGAVAGPAGQAVAEKVASMVPVATLSYLGYLKGKQALQRIREAAARVTGSRPGSEKGVADTTAAGGDEQVLLDFVNLCQDGGARADWVIAMVYAALDETGGDLAEAVKVAGQKLPAPSAEKRWITIGGGTCDPESGGHCGGTHVFVDEEGRITRGPAALEGKPVNRLSQYTKPEGKTKPEPKPEKPSGPKNRLKPEKPRPEEPKPVPLAEGRPGPAPYQAPPEPEAGPQPIPLTRPQETPTGRKPETPTGRKPETPTGRRPEDIRGRERPGTEAPSAGGAVAPEAQGPGGTGDGQERPVGDQPAGEITPEGTAGGAGTEPEATPAEAPVKEEPLPASAEEVNRRLDRYEKFFRSKGNHKLADWMGTLREHIKALGGEAALRALGEDMGRGAGEEVQYGGANKEDAIWQNTGDFIEAYLGRNGITPVGIGDVAEAGGGRLLSSITMRGQRAETDPYLSGDFVPAETQYNDKLEEAKDLPGLEASEDIKKIMGRQVTHLTPDVTEEMDKKYGKGQWIIKAFGEEAAAGYGIFFPQRIVQIGQDARNTIWDSGEHLAQYGFEHLRESPTGGFGNALGASENLTREEPPEEADRWTLPKEYQDQVLRAAEKGGFLKNAQDFEGLRQGRNVGGMEHDVYEDPKTGRFVKFTKGGHFGQNKDLPEYLERHALANKLWPELGYKLDGVIKDPQTGEPQAVVSVNKIGGSPPSQDEVQAWFEEHGWQPNGDRAYDDDGNDLGQWNWTDPRTGTQLGDAGAANFRKTPDGKIIPIDVDLIPGKDMRQQLTKEEPSRIMGIKHQGGDQYWFNSEKYGNTIQGDARQWADKAQTAAPNERGAALPDGGRDFMAQPAFKVVGVSEEERAQGVTIKQGSEGRTHVVVRNGKAEWIPHTTWMKGESLPVVFESEDTKGMVQAALDAINKLPEHQRNGQVYAPDIVKTADGFRVIELNASVEYGASGYLGDNPFVMDSYVSHLTNRSPAHVRFIRNLLTKKKRGEKSFRLGDVRKRWARLGVLKSRLHTKTEGGPCEQGQTTASTGCRSDSGGGGKKPAKITPGKPADSESVRAYAASLGADIPAADWPDCAAFLAERGIGLEAAGAGKYKVTNPSDLKLGAEQWLKKRRGQDQSQGAASRSSPSSSTSPSAPTLTSAASSGPVTSARSPSASGPLSRLSTSGSVSTPTAPSPTTSRSFLPTTPARSDRPPPGPPPTTDETERLARALADAVKETDNYATLLDLRRRAGLAPDRFDAALYQLRRENKVNLRLADLGTHRGSAGTPDLINAGYVNGEGGHLTAVSVPEKGLGRAVLKNHLGAGARK
jgi:hypothetical protein